MGPQFREAVRGVVSDLVNQEGGESAAVQAHVTPRERATLLVSVLIISICALTYELIVATLSSYLLGDSITQFSFTIGLFLSAMGLGALLSRRIARHEVRWFIIVEVLTGLFGGVSAAILYATFTAINDYYYLVMVVMVLAIGICIGLEIPLLTRIVARRADLSHALADVLSIDYLGALIGSLAFPLILLPLLGVTQTAFLMGMLNILVAGLNLCLFRERIPASVNRWLWVGAGACGALMITGSILSADFVRFFEQQLYDDHIIYREQTPYQRIVITRGGEDVRLFLNGDIQFSSRDEYRYHEVLVHPVMSLVRSYETIAILGGGDGMVIRELLQYPEVKRIILVDLDPAITTLAREHSILRRLNRDALADPRVTIINEDAYKYIEETGEQFNLVIIDLPDPNNESLSKLYSQQFYRLLRKRLTPDGAFVTQAASPYFVREAFWVIVHTIQASEFFALPLRTHVPSFGEWGFVIGTIYRPPALAVPEGLTLRYLTPDVLAQAQSFDPDIAEIPTGINTLDNPLLSRVYERGWQQWQ